MNARRPRILEMDQQSDSRKHGFQLNDELQSPLSPGKKSRLGQPQVRAQVSYRGEYSGQEVAAGAETNVESQSHRRNDLPLSTDQDQRNILKAGVHIPKLIANKAGGMMTDLGNITRDDSFEIACKLSEIRRINQSLCSSEHQVDEQWCILLLAAWRIELSTGSEQ